ncbi:MAG: murein biosynthesis integral membrane protein MurJ [Phycisphaerales bacterium]|nr:murein biosynthesis integral membrane protein MurJ [Phycisphaerales bacterium]
MTLASRVLGVLREMAYSYFFGATPLLSDFRFAFQIPNLSRRLFGEGALTSSFIPVFTKYRQADGDEPAKQLAGGVFTLVVTILSAMTVLAEVALLVVEYFKPFSAASLTMILLPYMVLICATALLAGVLNSLHRFAAPAIAPILLNVVLISATWLGGTSFGFDPRTHLRFIAFATLLAGCLQISIQVLWLKAIGFSIKPNFKWSSPPVRRVVSLLLPMILGVSVIQLNTFIDSVIAFTMVNDGKGLAELGYAQFLSHLPLGVFSTAIATAIFPLLSRHAAEGDETGFASSLDTGLRTSLFIAIPAGVGLILIAPHLVRLLYERGEFTSADTNRVVTALQCYCFGLWAYSAQQILVRGFYAKEDTKSPVYISVAMVGLNLMLNILLVRTSMREAGVALATAISAAIQIVLLAGFLKARVCTIHWPTIARSVLKSAFAAAVMGAGVWAMLRIGPLSRSLASDGRAHTMIEATQLGVTILIGAGIYGIIARLLNTDELKVLINK